MAPKLDKQKVIQIKSRRKARKFALQAIYQWNLGGQVDSAEQLEVKFKSGNTYHKYVDWELFSILVRGVLEHHELLGGVFAPLLSNDFDQLNQVELSILRLGCFELKYCKDTPFKVVISEYVDLANEFGAVDGEKFVNSILDKVAKLSRD